MDAALLPQLPQVCAFALFWLCARSLSALYWDFPLGSRDLSLDLSAFPTLATLLPFMVDCVEVEASLARQIWSVS